LFPNRSESARNFQFVCLERKPGCNISVLLFSIDKPISLQSSEISLIGEPKSLIGISFNIDQKLHFRLTANPTKILTEDTPEKRKIRVPLIKEEQQREWIERHLDGCAEIEMLTIQNETPIFFNRGGAAGKIVPVLYEGILNIRDPIKFKEIVYTKCDKKENCKEIYIAGIGPAKAFGCGLMLVRRCD
jgi:CRISPR system Cascade subunit CasE